MDGHGLQESLATRKNRTEPHQFEGYIVNPGGHWYAMRRVNRDAAETWYNLDSLSITGPRRITKQTLLRTILDTESAGGSVYVAQHRPPRKGGAAQRT